VGLKTGQVFDTKRHVSNYTGSSGAAKAKRMAIFNFPRQIGIDPASDKLLIIVGNAPLQFKNRSSLV